MMRRHTVRLGILAVLLPISTMYSASFLRMHVSREQAIEIARRTASADDSEAARGTYEAVPDGDGWAVSVRHIVGHTSKGTPLVFLGDDCLIIVDRRGRVVDYIRGF
jgi:hypothetical protein